MIAEMELTINLDEPGFGNDIEVSVNKVLYPDRCVLIISWQGSEIVLSTRYPEAMLDLLNGALDSLHKAFPAIEGIR